MKPFCTQMLSGTAIHNDLLRCQESSKGTHWEEKV